VQRGAGGAEGATFETILYEGYAPGGVAVLVEVLTDNRNRAASDIRNLFTRYGGSLGGAGSVSWMFDRQGIITVDRSKAKEDDVLSTALEAGAEDIRTSGDGYEIVTSPEQFFKVKQAMDRARLPISSAPRTTLRWPIVSSASTGLSSPSSSSAVPRRSPSRTSTRRSAILGRRSSWATFGGLSVSRLRSWRLR